MADLIPQLRKEPGPTLKLIKDTNPLLRDIFNAIPPEDRAGMACPARGSEIKQWLMAWANNQKGMASGDEPEMKEPPRRGAPPPAQEPPQTPRGGVAAEPPASSQNRQPNRTPPQQTRNLYPPQSPSQQAPPPQQQQPYDNNSGYDAPPQHGGYDNSAPYNNSNQYDQYGGNQYQQQPPPQQPYSNQYQQQPPSMMPPPPRRPYSAQSMPPSHQQPYYPPQQQQPYHQGPPSHSQTMRGYGGGSNYGAPHMSPHQQDYGMSRLNVGGPSDYGHSGYGPDMGHSDCVQCQIKDARIKKLTDLVNSLINQMEDVTLEARGDLTFALS